jgi:hypothetical protein
LKSDLTARRVNQTDLDEVDATLEVYMTTNYYIVRINPLVYWPLEKASVEDDMICVLRKTGAAALFR